MKNGTVQRLTLATGVAGSPFIGSTAFFPRCDDGNLMSLHHGGRMGLLDLFDWQVSDEYTKTMSYLTYVRPEYSGGNPTAGHLSDPCADPNGYEFGKNEITISGFGRYGRTGPVRELMHPTMYCQSEPRVRLDGSPVTSELEWDMAFAMDAMKQDLYRHIITGNNTTAGQLDGLQRWIKTGYGSSMLDSMVVEWAGNDFDGAGGGTKTFNGTNLAASTGMIDLLRAIDHRFDQRISWSPMLATSAQQPGDRVLVLPDFLRRCLLDVYTCWRICPGAQYQESNLNTIEARNFREGLEGGAFGAGYITLNGRQVHLFPYDWETMHGTQRGDMYFLNINVGNTRLWNGEILSASAAAQEAQTAGHTEYRTTDGDRVLSLVEVDNLCKKLKLWMRPRIINRAPWLQARIMNVECTSVIDPISPDPLETSFYPLTSFGGDAEVTA